jgi:hypothetical protein
MDPIAYTEFAGGAMRPVYEDDRGQFVIDDDGRRTVEGPSCVGKRNEVGQRELPGRCIRSTRDGRR